MNNLKYCICLICFVFFSCRNKDGQVKDAICVNLEKIEQTFIDSISVNDVSYVFLETKPECLIGEMQKLMITDSMIYVFDKLSTKTIFSNSLSEYFVAQAFTTYLSSTIDSVLVILMRLSTALASFF